MSYLVIEAIGDVPGLESQDQPHRVCDFVKSSATGGLFANHANVNENPEDESGSKFIEGLDVKGTNRRIQFATYKPLEDRDERKVSPDERKH